ncbi:cannabinoid receptor 2 [Larimichthys crocea]|uniref:cannabinoid receptor 2 n=1 Tax=Larimichthys crocea TaxID=215358 RepID=UPI000F5D7567|nr:cannabinoid receptor 2 [Larimichthys crocea]XP_019130218.2 cannabinoid receptor 2 [Larimichthys crocea]XP_019130219.2 cannabinoid receptor 2 [Larimichthys crocea]XP_027141786.1 cannabinoid receptor 2 [Larimichthys crocea]
MEEWKIPTSLGPPEAKENTSSSMVTCDNLECYMVLTDAEKTAIGSICFLAGPVTLLENALVLAVIAATATLRQRPSYLFIGSLALADVFASCFFTTSFLDFHLFRRSDGPNAYLFKLGGVTMAFSSSVGSLLLTALDRYLCIHQASSYKVLLTRRRALLSLLILWSATIFISFLPLMGWRCPTVLTPPCSCLFPYINQEYQVCWTSFILVLLALILGAYALILLKAHRHESSMTSLQGATGTGHARMRMDIRLARTFGLILLILVGCWLPALSFMLADFSVVLTHTQKRAFAFCSTLCLVNSAVNPLLYALRCRELRIALMQLLHRLCLIGRCKKSTEESTPGFTSTEDNNCIAISEDEMSRTRTTRLNSVSEVVNHQELNIIK